MSQVTLDPSQAAAVDLMVSAQFACITGGAGVGKTTSLRVALDRLDEQGRTYALAAPAGKAARRMSEATGRHASTIHRLLGWQPFGGWAHNASNPLPYDVVFIDESSMVDLEISTALTKAMGRKTRLVLIGDYQQLASVGPGRVFADVIESGLVPVARLTVLHRAAAESWVCLNAPKVLTGGPLNLDTKPDFRFIECESTEDVARMVAQLAAEKDAPWFGAQTLTPQRSTPCGIDALNIRLQETLNPPADGKREWKLGETVLRVGDRVIHTRNDYKLGVFNGEVATIKAIEEKIMWVDFGDRTLEYQKTSALDLDLAYALTVHRYQGSESPWIVCVVHSAHSYMLDRSLLYTMLTRAKKGVILVGNRAGLRAAIEAKDPPKRNTKLVERMREILQPAPEQAAAPSLAPPTDSPAASSPAPSASVPESLASAPAANTQDHIEQDIPW